LRRALEQRLVSQELRGLGRRPILGHQVFGEDVVAIHLCLRVSREHDDAEAHVANPRLLNVCVIWALFILGRAYSSFIVGEFLACEGGSADLCR
jgi:hypothetical protein